MRIALLALVLLAPLGCARAGETVVRDRAGQEFACADYALTVVEVGPEVYRATGCGQELIYACQTARVEDADEPVTVCSRTLR
jgi:hypothetical protein